MYMLCDVRRGIRRRGVKVTDITPTYRKLNRTKTTRIDTKCHEDPSHIKVGLGYEPFEIRILVCQHRLGGEGLPTDVTVTAYA
jgi:hypothetical protein